MKLRENTTLTRPRIFDGGYEHPWYEYQKQELIKPNPPTKEAVEKSRFIDKTYRWNGSDGSGSRRSAS